MCKLRESGVLESEREIKWLYREFCYFIAV
jgi:hypothetical protein